LSYRIHLLGPFGVLFCDFINLLKGISTKYDIPNYVFGRKQNYKKIEMFYKKLKFYSFIRILNK